VVITVPRDGSGLAEESEAILDDALCSQPSWKRLLQAKDASLEVVRKDDVG